MNQRTLMIIRRWPKSKRFCYLRTLQRLMEVWI